MMPTYHCAYCGEPAPSLEALTVARCCPTMELRYHLRRIAPYLPSPPALVSQPVPALSTPHAGGER